MDAESAAKQMLNLVHKIADSKLDPTEVIQEIGLKIMAGADYETGSFLYALGKNIQLRYSEQVRANRGKYGR